MAVDRGTKSVLFGLMTKNETIKDLRMRLAASKTNARLLCQNRNRLRKFVERRHGFSVMQRVSLGLLRR